MNYYETHTRDETCEHFNIFSQDVKEMCKEHGYKKPPNLYKIFATDKNPAKRDDVRLKLSQKAKERESKRRAALIVKSGSCASGICLLLPHISVT